MNIITLLVLCVIAAFFAVLHYFVTVRPRDRLRPIFQKELSALIITAQHWQGSEYDLVNDDTDRDHDPDRTWRVLRFRPRDDVRWRIQIRPDRGYQLELCIKGQPKLWFPEFGGWRDEPWTRAEMGALLSAVAKLPPPRTQAEHLEETRRVLKASSAKRAADFPSLDDPMDDME